MIAGLPGTGIGGMYYLIIALWMPFNGLLQSLRKGLPVFKMGIIRQHIFLTVMVIGGMWVTGWLLGICLAILMPPSSGMTTSLGSLAIARNVIQITPLILTLVTLTLVYLGMQGIRILVRWRRINGIHPSNLAA